MPKANEGKIDRFLRMISGIVLALAAFYRFTGTMQGVAYFIAAVLIITAATGFCALYSVFGVSTKTKQ
ncbi:DUF2892 domain-containing protein [Candidatus Woesearchaeota archaeon]|nr:DUF2892 domain-containing protein [Candidatus Woesearchaeota archaeon]